MLLDGGTVGRTDESKAGCGVAVEVREPNAVARNDE